MQVLRTFNVALSAVLLSSLSWGQKYELAELGFPSGDTWSHASDINNLGQISGSGNSKGFLWDPSQGFSTFDLGVGNSNNVHAINNSGHVAGSYYNGKDEVAFDWSEQTGIQDRLGEGLKGSHAYSINDLNQLVGETFNIQGGRQAARYDPGIGWKTLGDLTLSTAFGLNIHGDAVGQWYNGGGLGIQTPFLYTDAGGMIDLGLPSDMNQGTGRKINDSGTIAGVWARKEDLSWRAWIRKPDGEYIRIEPPLLPGQTWPYDINNHNQVVGYYTNVNGTFSFIWSEETGLQDLGSLTIGGFAGYQRVIATGISDTGYISATGIVNGVPHALLLTPVPEPSLWLGFVGVLGLLGFRRRRL